MIDPGTELLAEPKEVDVVAIEREITKLWREYAAGDSDSPITRACSLNFVVATEDESELEKLANEAGDVTIEHPARFFLICLNRKEDKPKLEAWISARCSLPVPGGKQICCEQISLTAHGAEVEKVPSIITSLLVPDVPCVVLWKLKVDTKDNVLQSLANVANRILLDSSEDPSPEEGLLAWESFLRNQDAHITFGDLAWTHLTPWRSAAANAFQSRAMLSHLGAIHSVAIEYSSTPEPRHSGVSQSLLLVSWLSQKLRWVPLEGMERSEFGEYSGVFERNGKSIDVHIQPVPPRAGFPGGIESVTIGSPGGLMLRWSTTEHRDCIRFTKRVDNSEVEEVQNIRGDKTEAELFSQELEVLQRDKGYEAVLKTLVGWLKA